MAPRRFELPVAEPFRLDLTAWALRRRPHNAVDRFDGIWYRRTMAVDGRAVEVAVRRPDGADAGLEVELWRAGSRPGRAAEEAVGSRLRRVLALEVDLGGFYRLAARDAALKPLAARFRGMRPPRFPTVFEALVNAIACQQLSLTVGIHLLNRLAERYGPSAAGGNGPWGFPAPARLAGAEPEDLVPLGFSRAKARAIVTLARRVTADELDLEALDEADDDTVRAVLLGIRGVGRWSAEYTMLRGLGRLQVLPADDVGARNRLQRHYGLPRAAGYEELSELARAWSPYGGLVYLHLLLDGLAEAGHVRAGPHVPG